MQTAKFIVFSGSVQGVGFRYTAHRIAVRYNITGYVRNTSDGKVEMYAKGNLDNINDCITDLKESFSGYIRNVDVRDAALSSDYDGFMIKV